MTTRCAPCSMSRSAAAPAPTRRERTPSGPAPSSGGSAPTAAASPASRGPPGGAGHGRPGDRRAGPVLRRARAAVRVEALRLRPAPGPGTAGCGGRVRARRGGGRDGRGGRRRARGRYRAGGVTLRPVTTEADVGLLIEVHERVFGGTTPGSASPCSPGCTRRPTARPWCSPWPGTSRCPLPGRNSPRAPSLPGLWGGGTLPAWRGRGIYRALVAYRAGLAASRGYRYLTVDASADSEPIRAAWVFAAWRGPPPGSGLRRCPGDHQGVAVVTGAGSGLGREITRALLGAGWRVARRRAP